eukprot:m51a1_g7189 hypothetical protein (1150) ;mRNA; r:115396-120256
MSRLAEESAVEDWGSSFEPAAAPARAEQQQSSEDSTAAPSSGLHRRTPSMLRRKKTLGGTASSAGHRKKSSLAGRADLDLDKASRRKLWALKDVLDSNSPVVRAADPPKHDSCASLLLLAQNSRAVPLAQLVVEDDFVFSQTCSECSDHENEPDDDEPPKKAPTGQAPPGQARPAAAPQVPAAAAPEQAEPQKAEGDGQQRRRLEEMIARLEEEVQRLQKREAARDAQHTHELQCKAAEAQAERAALGKRAAELEAAVAEREAMVLKLGAELLKSKKDSAWEIESQAKASQRVLEERARELQCAQERVRALEAQLKPRSASDVGGESLEQVAPLFRTASHSTENLSATSSDPFLSDGAPEAPPPREHKDPAAKIASLEAHLKKATRERKKAVAALAAKEEELHDCRHAVSRLQEQLSRVHATEYYLASTVRNDRDQIDGLRRQLGGADDEQSPEPEASEASDASERRAADLERALQDAEKKLADKETEIGTLSQRLAAAEAADTKELEAALQETEKKLAEKETQCSSLSDSVASSAKQLEALGQRVKDLEGALQEAERKLAEQDTQVKQIEPLQQRTRDLEAALQEAEKKLSERDAQQAQLDALAQRARELAASLQEAERRLAEKEVQLTSLSQQQQQTAKPATPSGPPLSPLKPNACELKVRAIEATLQEAEKKLVDSDSQVAALAGQFSRAAGATRGTAEPLAEGGEEDDRTLGSEIEVSEKCQAQLTGLESVVKALRCQLKSITDGMRQVQLSHDVMQRSLEAKAAMLQKQIVENAQLLECLTKLRYSCLIPPIPCDPKALSVSAESRYVKYQATSLERGHRFDLHIAPDLGIPRDLVDPATHKTADPRPELAPQDYALLHIEDARKAPAVARHAAQQQAQGQQSQEQQAQAQAVASSESPQPSGGEPLSPARGGVAAAVAASAAAAAGVTVPPVEEQIRAIEESFAAAREPPVVNGETPEESYDIVPATELWANNYQHVHAKEGPFEGAAHRRRPEDEMALEERAIIKAFSSGGHNFVTFFTPKSVLGSGAQEPAEEEYDWTKEYTYFVPRSTGTGSRAESDGIAVVVQGDAARYVEVKRRVTLNKITDREVSEAVRRLKRGRRVRVARREMSSMREDEKKTRADALAQLAELSSGDEDDDASMD